MARIYEYKGKKYCEIDFSLKDENYAGDLYDFFWELRKDGIASDYTFYYCPEVPEEQYETAEELIENQFFDYQIGDIAESEE